MYARSARYHLDLPNKVHVIGLQLKNNNGAFQRVIPPQGILAKISVSCMGIGIGQIQRYDHTRPYIFAKRIDDLHAKSWDLT